MKIAHKVGMLLLCGLVVAGSALTAGGAAASSPRDIAAKPELVVKALRDQNAEDSAAIVAQSLAVIFASDWSESKKRDRVISLVTYAVTAKGMDAAPMMGLVAAGIPPVWLAVVAATAVMVAGDNSPAVAKAMLAAAAGNAQASDACRAACTDPSTVLSPNEIRMIRAVALPTPPQALAKAPPLPTPPQALAKVPPLPTILQPAEKYPGQ